MRLVAMSQGLADMDQMRRNLRSGGSVLDREQQQRRLEKQATTAAKEAEANSNKRVVAWRTQRFDGCIVSLWRHGSLQRPSDEMCIGAGCPATQTAWGRPILVTARPCGNTEAREGVKDPPSRC